MANLTKKQIEFIKAFKGAKSLTQVAERCKVTLGAVQTKVRFWKEKGIKLPELPNYWPPRVIGTQPLDVKAINDFLKKTL